MQGLNKVLRVDMCPVCGPSVFVRLGEGETSVRCLRCHGTPIALSLVAVAKGEIQSWQKLAVFEASSRGVVSRFLKKNARLVCLSEYFPQVKTGEELNGVQCQDLQALTFASGSFDICTSTEVMEHVTDDMAAFRELHRVLVDGGMLAFTVPLNGQYDTLERVIVRDGERTFLSPPAFHGDRLTGKSSVLVFRDYGADIVDRLLSAGFKEAMLIRPAQEWFGFSRSVVVAKK